MNKIKNSSNEFYYNLLTVNYSRLSLESITALSYQAFVNGIEIENYLDSYRGNNKLDMLKVYISLIDIYHKRIN